MSIKNGNTPESSTASNTHADGNADRQTNKYMPLGVFLDNTNGGGTHLGLTETWEESVAIVVDHLCGWFGKDNRAFVFDKLNNFRPRFESGEILAVILRINGKTGGRLFCIHRRVVDVDLQRECVIGISNGLFDSSQLECTLLIPSPTHIKVMNAAFIASHFPYGSESVLHV